MSDIFRKIKDAKEKEAADLFLQHILPLSGDLILCSKLALIHVTDFPRCFMTGLLKPSLNLQPGLRVGCRTVGLLP